MTQVKKVKEGETTIQIDTAEEGVINYSKEKHKKLMNMCFKHIPRGQPRPNFMAHWETYAYML